MGIEWLDGNGRELKLHIFPFLVRGREPARQWCYVSFSGWRTVTHSTVIAHQLRSAVSSTVMISSAQKTINSKAVKNWQNMLPEWEWEREGMGITNGNGKGMGIKLG